MTQSVIVPAPVASVEEIQQEWHELKARAGRLESEQKALEQENKALRFLLEKVIEHRQKTHSELVLLLSGLVSKLPINDIGVTVSRLVEHNTRVSEVCAALAKGKTDAALPLPSALQELERVRRDLITALKPAMEELIQCDPPLETEMLRSLAARPELFFSPAVVRANRCFVKGQVPRERIVREFGEGALAFFNDMTTDPKRNPRPKPEEIVLAFRPDFEALLRQSAAGLGEKAQSLLALYHKVQSSKAPTEQARLQRNAFLRMSFFVELLHYYENQNTESPENIFAQRLPALIEQLVLPGAQDRLEESLILQAESLLALILNPDHRLMVVNNLGKGGGAAKTLKYVLRLRTEKVADQNEVVPEFVKHLIPPSSPTAPEPKALTTVLRLLNAERQRWVVKAILSFDRINKEEAVSLGRALGKELGLEGLEDTKAAPAIPPEMERQLAWEKIKELIAGRVDPAAVAAAIRDRLNARYSADEIKQSWLTLIEADTISLIRIFSHLPYLPDGRTDAIARPVIEAYVARLMHVKYAATHTKVVNSLRNMFKANPNSPTLLNFMALVKWVDPEAANRLGADIGMAVPA